MRLRLYSSIMLLLLIVCISQPAYSFMYDEETDKASNSMDAKKEKEKEKDKTLEEVVAKMKAQSGIFTLYQDPESGKLHMQITEEQINKEFLYFAFVQNGVLEAFHRRGRALAQDVIELRRYYDRIEFVKKNTNYYIDPKTPLANGGMANITDAVLASAKISAKSKDGKSFLIDADTLFQTEALVQLSYNLNPQAKPFEQFSLGKLAEDKVKYAYVGVYPTNMNVRTDYVYDNAKPYVRGSGRVADARSTTITVQHSFLNVPENDFVPRYDDQRIGYFGAEVTDLNSFEITPYRDVISRWHLVKKDPNADVSEPVEPITWWIENTTPVEYREILRQGVLAWNSSFEKAGFKNAIEVKIQPDDASWSAEDVRYNVVRWSNTPGAGSAFGPSYINPRTGQILGGDVMFEHSFLSGYGLTGDVLSEPSAFLTSLVNGPKEHPHQDINASTMRCEKGYEMADMVSFGRVAMSAMNASVGEQRKIIEQMLIELMLHEVGHALGLNHNMKASNYRALDDINNDNVTQGITTSSVMDYTALIIAKPGDKQGDFFTTKPGPYDDWAIQFGYDPNIEGDARDVLLARSTEPDLMFGNDADDMRAPGWGIDPRVNIWDMSGDAIGFAQYQFELIDEVTPMLKAKLEKDGDSFAKLRRAMGLMISYNGRPAAVVTSFIGGIEVSRFVQGQQGATQPYKPVDKATQQRAMNVLSKYVLAPDAFELPEELLTHSAVQRRGFGLFGNTEDPKLHSAILGVQKVVFSRLFNPKLMMRMSDAGMYGNSYTVDQMMNDLTDAVFEADIKKTVNSRRQVLQNEYVTQLIGLLDSKLHDPLAKAATFAQLERIQKWVDEGRTKDNATKVHKNYLAYLIKKAMEA